MTLLIRHNITALHSTASCLKKVSGNKANLWGKWLIKFTSRFLDIISNWSWVLCERCSWHLNGIKRGTQGRSGEEIFKLPIVKQMTAWLKLGSLLMQSSFSPSFFAWDPLSHERTEFNAGEGNISVSRRNRIARKVWGSSNSKPHCLSQTPFENLRLDLAI